ncbi:aminotransferase class III-fold pyridoxal phosphate-dependent enzyme [Actinoalloteichus hymeniacidonis]|uniref:Ornithine/acetylornithine aminotransferase n=1 Tax=Actinoalloteichus hymeniacidonis TaxID=340345 RepID=A0AAC9HM52_9PSEU|nr:aminotransferase class III-fold pyridoxal phosphate-dependent enzyme [Actinoalloteichus hymeniacidonis]AOS61834.1 ornithine/acetylornithine aminotransferase [Actinoalloteichus hymeniacidonis]MBB5910146.1 acetylornithine/succinyldiaminopimelate/putrescine aminotransferase [Actinoalloteichus hymeniacidonis]
MSAAEVIGLPGREADRPWFDRDVQFDHYGGDPLPFGCTGANGIVQHFVELSGDQAGRSFEVLDASGGYGSACLGAGSPVIATALADAVREVGYVTDEIASAQRSTLLAGLFGTGGLFADRFPATEYRVSGRNSGSEGVELALRLALESRFDRRRMRVAAGAEQRDLVLAFEGAWHGWSGGLLPLVNRRHYRVGLPGIAPEPFGFSTDHIPFGDREAAEEWFARNGDRVLAVVVEPVQGDAGILVPPPGYLRELAALAKRHGAVLIADEVLTFAKTGRFFAMSDDEGPISTDITVIGKSLGMGVLSTSMVIARRELGVRPTGTVSTSDLRPLTCAVIRAGLAHIVAEGLVERSAEVGTHLGDLLRDRLVAQFPDLYQESRGVGLLHGIELTETAATRIGELRTCMIRSGVYVEFMSGAGRRSRGLRYLYPTMRVAPPLVVTAGQAAEIVDRLVEGSRAVRKLSA